MCKCSAIVALQAVQNSCVIESLKEVWDLIIQHLILLISNDLAKNVCGLCGAHLIRVPVLVVTKA